jgi:hypothetical protein
VQVAIGSVEQNVLIPAIARNVACMGFATIFQGSPLCIASLPSNPLLKAGDLVGKKVGMHIDSLELTSTLLSHATDR